jgi:membrane-associated phospholipid phosphatase
MINQTEKNPAAKKQILISILMVVLLIIVLFVFDKSILNWMQDLMGPENLPFAEMVTHNGLVFFYAVFAALFVFSLILKNKKWINLCIAYLLAQLIFSFGVVRILKVLFGRARPKYGSEFNFFSFGFDVNSFPSGHAADALVSGVFLYYLLKQSKWPMAGFLPLVGAFLIATTRVLVNSHYPSDVAAGMAIGIFGAWFFISRLPDPDKPELKIEN